jgi:hypothetical protein
VTRRLLDWSDSSKHWARADAPCRYCIGNLPTRLRDDDGFPAHKTCAEAELERRERRAAGEYYQERHDQL